MLTSPSAAASLGDTIMAWVAPLHVGNFAGNGVRVLWLLLGLAPPLLFLTGFTMWWTLVVRSRTRIARGEWRAGARSARPSDLGFEH